MAEGIKPGSDVSSPLTERQVESVKIMDNEELNMEHEMCSENILVLEKRMREEERNLTYYKLWKEAVDAEISKRKSQ